MKRIRSRGINEIKVKLLPEKAKRDYVLRLVSFIIILTFIIINLLIVYIPNTNYKSQLNDLKSENASKNLDLLNLQNKYKFFFQNIFNYNDNSIKDISNSTIDLNQIFLIFDNNATYVDVHDNLETNDLIKPENNIHMMPTGSTVLSVAYSEATSTFTFTVKFKTLPNLTLYEQQLQRIKYVTSIEVGTFTIDQTDQSAKTTFKMVIDPTSIYCPKVGVN